MDRIVIYLSGPMDQCKTEDEMIGWRNQVKKDFGEYASFYDPCDRKYDKDDKNAWMKIVEHDKEDIHKSNVILAYPWIKDGPMVGTSMEIMYAWEKGIPVVSVVDDVEEVSPWIRYHSDYIVESFEEAYTCIKHMYEPTVDEEWMSTGEDDLWL